MRVALVHWTRRVVGGAERHLSALFDALGEAGQEAAYLFELDRPDDRPTFGPATSWCVEELGVAESRRVLQAWAPDVILTHAILDEDLERALAGIAPMAHYVHGYAGMCISGTRMHAHPRPVACERTFGPGCLLHFLPRRCGGMSPATMVRDFARERRRLLRIRSYDLVVANSSHVGRELVRHGVDAARVVSIPPIPGGGTPAQEARRAPTQEGELRILFLGRMDRTKGGDMLLRSLAPVAERLGIPVRLDLAGDGSAAASWQRLASELDRSAAVEVRFHGWVGPDEMRSLKARAHLLVLPSLWPEPFGMVGPEAGAQGLPVAAFPIGGIPDWLADGVNGALAALPPSPGALADAILRCVSDPVAYGRMADRAREIAGSFGPEIHARGLLAALQRIAHGGGSASESGPGTSAVAGASDIYDRNSTV